MKTKLNMKKLIILVGVLVSLTAANIVLAQSAEGVITYEVKVNLHRRIPADRQEMKAMIPEFRTTKEQLFFNANESLYKPLIEDEVEDMNAGGGGVQIRMQQPNNEFYFDQANQVIVSKQEFMGKNYLIEDSLKLAPWKFGTETKMIQGYECKQAYYTDETRPEQKQEITAWYTDKIRPFLGPERFHSLPGAVLAVDINNGERVVVAKTLEFRSLKKNELKRPASGTKTTQDEFRKMVDEQIRQMGGRNGMIIRN
jgi:GLPGLI family protein